MSIGSITIKLKPRASRNFIRVKEDGTITISVTSPPVDNKANEHCISLLAKKLRCKKQSLHIIKGSHCRDKVIRCEELSEEEILHILEDD